MDRLKGFDPRDRDRLQRAKEAERRKEWAEAEKQWSELLSCNAAERALAYAGLARSLRMQEKLEEAHEMLRCALDEDPTHDRVILEAAEHYFAIQRWDLASGWFTEALINFGDKLESPYWKAGHALRRLGKIDDARSVLRQGLATFPGSLKIHQELCEIELIARKWPELFSHIRTVVHLIEDPANRTLTRHVMPLISSSVRCMMKALEGAQGRSGVTACLIVKDEADYLLEWISYYKALGFDSILIYDNSSTDGSQAILDALQSADAVKWVSWPDVPLQRPQYAAYDDALLRAETEWIGFFDIDEFLVLRHHNKINDFLCAFAEDVAAVSINWRIFGSSGLETKDDRPVIERFVKCASESDPMNRQTKSLGRIHAVRRSNVHAFEVEHGYRHVNACGEDYRRDAISLEMAQVNHYALKSREEFLQKDKKGWIVRPAGDEKEATRGGDTYFEWFDLNVEEDRSAQRLLDEVTKRMAQYLQRLADRCSGP